MRVDPDTVYLELSSAACVVNVRTGTTRYVPAAILHWKAGRKWQRASFRGGDDATLGDVLREVADAIDAKGSLDALIDAVNEARGTA